MVDIKPAGYTRLKTDWPDVVKVGPARYRLAQRGRVSVCVYVRPFTTCMQACRLL